MKTAIMTESVAYIKNALQPYYSPEEVRSLTRLVMKYVCHLEPYQLLIDKGNELSEAEKKQIKDITERLGKYEPIQYITGSATFCGYSFHVSPSVLIPRPETEELVELICRNENEARLRILDVGTGSGCIAIALSKRLKDTHMTAIDISPEALVVAERNARDNGAAVEFRLLDILSTPVQSEPLDILVSNPPYISEAEKMTVERNVLDYEPATALFVPAADPLLFYRTIASFGRKQLKPGGRLYFEINKDYGSAMLALLNGLGYADIELKQDIFGKDRFVKATLTNKRI